MIGVPRMGAGRCFLRLAPRSRFSIQGVVELMSGTRIVVNEEAHLEIGDGTYLHCGATVSCFEHIAIGPNCAISWNTTIVDGNGHVLIVEGESRPWSKPVIIDEHVWICSGATVLSGVTIHEGAVVGAGSLVTRDVPCRTTVAGNPARILGEDAEWVKEREFASTHL